MSKILTSAKQEDPEFNKRNGQRLVEVDVLNCINLGQHRTMREGQTAPEACLRQRGKARGFGYGVKVDKVPQRGCFGGIERIALNVSKSIRSGTMFHSIQDRRTVRIEAFRHGGIHRVV